MVRHNRLFYVGMGLYSLTVLALIIGVFWAWQWMSVPEKTVTDETALPLDAAEVSPEEMVESQSNQESRTTEPIKRPRVVAPELAPTWTKEIKATQPLQRVARPQPIADADQETAIAYKNVIVLASDLLKVRYGRSFIKVKLSNVEGLAFQAKCILQNGEKWPCGGWARNRLSQKLQEKSLTCKIDIQEEPSHKKIYPAKCWLGETSLADIIIREGWGKPAAPEYTYHAYLSEEAQRLGNGLWRKF